MGVVAKAEVSRMLCTLPPPKVAKVYCSIPLAKCLLFVVEAFLLTFRVVQHCVP